MADDDAVEKKVLGAQLKKIRMAAGYTLDSAADALVQRGHEIGRGAIGAWETGRNVPNALWLKRMARLYDVPVDAMFSDTTVSIEALRLASKLRDVVLQDSEAASADERALRQHSLRAAIEEGKVGSASAKVRKKPRR